MNAALKRAFGHAHRRTVVEFSATAAEDGAQLVWWLVGSSYSAGMEAVKGSVKAANAGISSMVEMAVDAVTLNVRKAGFGARKPRIGDLFLVGPAATGGTAPQVADCKRYVCTGVGDTEINDHYHITAEKHA